MMVCYHVARLISDIQLFFFRSSLLLDLTKLCLEHDRVGLAEEYVAAAMGAAKVWLSSSNKQFFNRIQKS